MINWLLLLLLLGWGSRVFCCGLFAAKLRFGCASFAFFSAVAAASVPELYGQTRFLHDSAAAAATQLLVAASAIALTITIVI